MPDPDPDPDPLLTVTEELHYRVLKHLAAHPEATQRDLAQALGISVGSTNYCLRAVIDKGWIKAQNFLNSKKKRAYAHLLTPAGLEAKARIAVSFLQRKRAEYETLKTEIEQLAAEVDRLIEAGEGTTPVRSQSMPASSSRQDAGTQCPGR